MKSPIDPTAFILSFLPVFLPLLWIWLRACFDVTSGSARDRDPHQLWAFASLYKAFFVLLLALLLTGWAHTSTLCWSTAGAESTVVPRGVIVAMAVLVLIIYAAVIALAIAFFRRVRALLPPGGVAH